MYTLWNHWDTHRCLISIAYIVRPKEGNQEFLFPCPHKARLAMVQYVCHKQRLTLDPKAEEPPEYDGISDQTHQVAHYELCAQTPPEETEIAGVP